MLTPREKRGADTEKLSEFIEEVTNLYEKHYRDGLSLSDSSFVLMRVSMSTLMKLGTVRDARELALYMRDYADAAVKSIDQHN